MKPIPTEIVFLAAKRTPFGTYGGALKDVSATDLAVHAAKAALAQSKVAPEDVDNVVFGNVLQTSADAIYLARHVGLRAGLPQHVPALTVNRLCGSGFQAVVDVAVGRRPFSDWDQIVKDWRTAAGDQVRKEYLDAFAAAA